MERNMEYFKDMNWRRVKLATGKEITGFLFGERVLLESGKTVGLSKKDIVDIQYVQVKEPLMVGKIRYMQIYSRRHGVTEVIRKWKVLFGEDRPIDTDKFKKTVVEMFKGIGYEVTEFGGTGGYIDGVKVRRFIKAPDSLIRYIGSTEDKNEIKRKVRKALVDSGMIQFGLNCAEQYMDLYSGNLMHMALVQLEIVGTVRGLESFKEDFHRDFKVMSIKDAVQAVTK